MAVGLSQRPPPAKSATTLRLAATIGPRQRSDASRSGERGCLLVAVRLFKGLAVGRDRAAPIRGPAARLVLGRYPPNWASSQAFASSLGIVQ